jgi:hypothetical protein
MFCRNSTSSESVLTNHYHYATLAHVSRRFSGQVEIVPGVVGPEQIIDPRPALLTPDGSVDIQLDIRFDPRQRRYVCHEVRATSNTGAAVTTEVLRDLQIAHWIVLALLTDSDEGPVIRELENPDGREPWGKTAPDGVVEHGPTDRALRWTAHFYRYGYAVSYNPTKGVEEMLKLPRSTAGRWIAAARKAGHLGPSEGMGKAGG